MYEPSWLGDLASWSNRHSFLSSQRCAPLLTGTRVLGVVTWTAVGGDYRGPDQETIILPAGAKQGILRGNPGKRAFRLSFTRNRLALVRPPDVVVERAFPLKVSFMPCRYL